MGGLFFIFEPFRKVSRCLTPYARAGSLIFVQELAEQVQAVVEAERDRLDAVLIFPSMPEVMRLNKVGGFTMASLGQSKSVVSEFMKKKKADDGSSFEEAMLKLLRTLPKVLKYLPGLLPVSHHHTRRRETPLATRRRRGAPTTRERPHNTKRRRQGQGRQVLHDVLPVLARGKPGELAVHVALFGHDLRPGGRRKS